MGVSENAKRPGYQPKLGYFGKTYPLLAKRMSEYGFDEPSGAPLGDRITVWRLPPITMSPSGTLFLPDNRDEPNVIGVLVACGMKALDELESNGVHPGHYVVWERFTGWEADDPTPELKRCSRFLQLNARNILNSLDLMTDLESGQVRYLRGADGRSQLDVRPALPAKAERQRGKLLAMANDPATTPSEKRTARRLATRKT